MKTTGPGGGGEGRGREPRFERAPNSERAPSEGAPNSDDNVVRLPRDWLGPRDELVPFGPSAAPKPPGSESEAGAPSSTADDGPPAAVSPADFWGEHAAALHDAFEERDEAFAKRVVLRARSMLPFARLRRPVLAAGCAVALALVAVGYVSLVSETGSRSRAGVNLSQLGVTWPWSFRPRLSPRHPVRSSGRSARPTHRATGARAMPVSYSSQRSTQGKSLQSASSLSTSSTTPAAPVIPTSSTPSPSTTASVGARPKSPAPAFGAHGALGPGRSATR
jgi:hypothetical protein